VDNLNQGEKTEAGRGGQPEKFKRLMLQFWGRQSNKGKRDKKVWNGIV